MNILGLDFDFEQDSVDSDSYSSSTSLLNYDIVVWDLKKLPYLYDLQPTSYHTGNAPSLAQHNTELLLDDRARRNAEIQELFALGKLLVIIVPEPFRLSLYSDAAPYYEVFGLETFVPVQGFHLNRASGTNIRFSGSEPLFSFHQSIQHLLRYSAFLDDGVGEPYAFIADTQKCVGSLGYYGNGFALFMPTFADQLSATEKHEFLEALQTLYCALTPQPGELPRWTKKFLIPSESERKLELADLEREKARIEAQIAAKHEEIAHLEAFKALFAADGELLEQKVREILESLGFVVQPKESEEGHLLADFQGHPAVVEIKGLSKSAGEKNAAQLEKEAATYYDVHGVEAKGILIANTHKETPLDQRSQRSFPTQMLPYSTKRGHCLITGVQLLGLYLDAQAHPGKADSLVESLFSTVGVYKDYSDWHSFLEDEER